MVGQRDAVEAEVYWGALRMLRTGSDSEVVDALHALIKLALHGGERVSRLAREALSAEGFLVQTDPPAIAGARTGNAVIRMD